MTRVEQGSVVSARISFRLAGGAGGIYAHSVSNADEYIFSDFVAATAAEAVAAASDSWRLLHER